MQATRTTRSGISVIVTAANGCAHAVGPIGALVDQLGPDDQLILMEAHLCHTVPTGGEIHVCAGTEDDYELALAGLCLADCAVIAVLEDHVVVGEDFIATLRSHFANDDVLATTFYFKNGTMDRIGSRTLFGYVAGFATWDGAERFPEPVCSSYAVRQKLIEQWLPGLDDPDTGAGLLPTQMVPAVIAGHRVTVPEGLTVTHYQSNTFRQALSAIYWNARRAGTLERTAIGSAQAVGLVTRRYLGRSLKLGRMHAHEPELFLPFMAMGIAGMTAWWQGRWWGCSDVGHRLAEVHPAVN